MIKPDSLNREILKIAMPSMMALMAEPLLGLFDTILIGRYGTKELAAAAGISYILSSFIWLFNFLSTGTTARVATLYGGGDKKEIGRYSSLAFSLSIIIGVFLTLAFYFGGNYAIELYGFSDEVAPLAAEYLQIRLWGIIFTLFFYTGLGFYRGLQNAVIPMYASIATNLLNLILDILLIYGYKDIIPEMGIAGAAWATVSAQIAGALILVWFALKNNYIRLYGLFNTDWNRAHFSQLFRLSIHLFLRTFFLLLGFLIGGSVAARMGTVIQAADEIAMKLWLLGSFTMDAFAVAGQALIGKYKGSEAGSKTLPILKKRLLYWGAGIGLAFLVLYFFNRDFIIGLFTEDRDVIYSILTVFPLMALFQPINSITFVSDGILIGQERTRYMMKMTFFASLIFSGGAILSLMMNWGLAGLWWSISGMMLWRFTTNLLGIRH